MIVFVNPLLGMLIFYFFWMVTNLCDFPYCSFSNFWGWNGSLLSSVFIFFVVYPRFPRIFEIQAIDFSLSRFQGITFSLPFSLQYFQLCFLISPETCGLLKSNFLTSKFMEIFPFTFWFSTAL